jgi:hypothetical protein
MTDADDRYAKAQRNARQMASAARTAAKNGRQQYARSLVVAYWRYLSNAIGWASRPSNRSERPT